MIVVDVETGGLDPLINPLLSIGAVDYETGDEFYIECGANPRQDCDDAALAINGFTSEQAFSPSKPSGQEAYARFVEWARGRSNVLAGQQVGSFDIPFLHVYAGGKTAFEKVFSRRSIDLHSVAYARFGDSMSLDGILKACGLAPEPKPHNALTGARLERDAFKVLLGGAPCGCRADGWKS